MLTLYDFGNSVCCQKVRITLRAKQLAWESIKVDLFKAEQYDPKYLKLNPSGTVPTLVHDGNPCRRERRFIDHGISGLDVVSEPFRPSHSHSSHESD
jgi:glutathione S-transferase